MQYPQIQFYRGSLVRLASGKLKQVEDLSSDDFLESARFINRASTSNTTTATPTATITQPNKAPTQTGQHPFKLMAHRHQSTDENNNSVFNSPEPSSSFNSPTMEVDELDLNNNSNSRTNDVHFKEEDEDDDEELDVVSGGDQLQPINLQLENRLNPFSNAPNQLSHARNQHHYQLPQHQQSHGTQQQQQQQQELENDLYIDSSVVRDFLEVGPPSSTSPASSTSSSISLHNQQAQQPNEMHQALASTSNSSLTSISSSSSPLVNPTVLIKFFLESTRTTVFIEVPIEHPFFVFHRGWSSWNPQRTYDKFGLKCRKLKIGDTCISLIRRQRKQTQLMEQHHSNGQQESDQCNILFSSIKINE